MIKLKIEYMSTDELKPYERNAKIHTAEQIEQIMQIAHGKGWKHIEDNDSPELNTHLQGDYTQRKQHTNGKTK